MDLGDLVDFANSVFINATFRSASVDLLQVTHKIKFRKLIQL